MLLTINSKMASWNGASTPVGAAAVRSFVDMNPTLALDATTSTVASRVGAVPSGKADSLDTGRSCNCSTQTATL